MTLTRRFLAGMIQWPRPGKIGAYITLFLAIARYLRAGDLRLHLLFLTYASQVRLHPPLPALQRAAAGPERHVGALRVGRGLHRHHGPLQVTGG